MLQSMEELLMTGKHSDITGIVQEREFRLHKAILALCSPVFSAMLEYDTQEKESGIVKITD